MGGKRRVDNGDIARYPHTDDLDARVPWGFSTTAALRTRSGAGSSQPQPTPRRWISKELTDELFRYFLVYGKAELELSLESYDGRLLEQLLGEAEFDLIDSGFRVQRIEFKGECSVSADPLYLKRTLDNMISNIKKIRRPRAPDHGDNRAD